MHKLPAVAEYLGVSLDTARRYVKSGEIPSTFIGGAYRVREEDLEAFVESRRSKPGKAGAPSEPGQPRQPEEDSERRRERYLEVWCYQVDDLIGHGERWLEEKAEPASDGPEMRARAERAEELVRGATRMMDFIRDILGLRGTDPLGWRGDLPEWESGMLAKLEEGRGELYRLIEKLREKILEDVDQLPEEQAEQTASQAEDYLSGERDREHAEDASAG